MCEEKQRIAVFREALAAQQAEFDEAGNGLEARVAVLPDVFEFALLAERHFETVHRDIADMITSPELSVARRGKATTLSLPPARALASDHAASDRRGHQDPQGGRPEGRGGPRSRSSCTSSGRNHRRVRPPSVQTDHQKGSPSLTSARSSDAFPAARVRNSTWNRFEAARRTCRSFCSRSSRAGRRRG